jgi:UDP-glucose 4-epimerase
MDMRNGIGAQQHIESTLRMQNTKVLVTGAAGYIGGQICIELKKKGYYVIGIDRRYRPHLNKFYDQFWQIDFCSEPSFNVLDKEKPDAIIHCAGTSLVGPSIKDPDEYYGNNFQKTYHYLKVLKSVSPKTKFIFSSSASVYGIPAGSLDETHSLKPISPYGESKVMVENMLASYAKAYGLDYVAFRYFNACGADEEAQHGQEPNASHIFAQLFESAKGDNPFTLYGMTYDTKDKTCIRDYVHVQDIADVHIMAIEKDMRGVYNIGSGEGFSNLEIFVEVEEFFKKELVMIVEAPREGDPAVLVANPKKLFDLDYRPKRQLTKIIESLNLWYSSEIYNRQRTSNDIHPS